jgi:hypothetical protein
MERKIEIEIERESERARSIHPRVSQQKIGEERKKE